MNEKNTESMSKKIASYIDYLSDTHGLDISFHISDSYSYVLYVNVSGNLVKYNSHKNPYCFHIKSNELNHRKCLKCQWMAIKKCRDVECYTGICHAGVGEYIRRIFIDGETVGFVSVSGYRSDKKNIGEDIWYDANIINQEIPIGLLDTVIPPLCIMLENFIAKTPKNDESDDVYLQILSYLNEHHSSVTLDELCAKFNYSKSYISHMFRKKSGYTLKHYCNLLKIKDSKLLLENTAMSITDIAFSVGFNDFSYFINTFKNITGETPLSWRKSR